MRLPFLGYETFEAACLYDEARCFDSTDLRMNKKVGEVLLARFYIISLKGGIINFMGANF